MPETLLTPEFNYLFESSRYQDESNKIFVVIDECHCIVQWGVNFRTKYKDIHPLRCLLPQCNFLCLMATASVTMQLEISQNLHLRLPNIIVGPLDRSNIFLAAKDVSSLGRGLDSEDRFRQLIKPFLSELTTKCDKFGKKIIYCKMQNWCVLGYEEAVAANVQNFVRQYHADFTEEVNLIIITTIIIIIIALIIFIPTQIVMTHAQLLLRT